MAGIFLGRSKEQAEYEQGVRARDCSCGMHIYTVEYNYHLMSGEHNAQMESKKGLSL